MAQGREWLIEQSDFETVEDFRLAVGQELAGLENMGHRTGRGFTVAPIRVLVERDGRPPVYMTMGWLFREVFMPAAKPAAAGDALEVPEVPAEPALVEA